MRISYNWLKDYLDLDLPVEEISDILTDIGLEVEAVEKFESFAGGLQGLVIGDVVAVEKHPDADRLKIAKVNVGNGGDLQIVCGAPNVAAGQKVIVALTGTTIHPTNGEPFEIKKAKIRGVESNGMICAEDEIGIGEDHSGIIILPDDVRTGTKAETYYNVERDTIFEIGLTPNRADAMSHIGVARDLYAYLNFHKAEAFKLKSPELDSLEMESEDSGIQVEVMETSACPRYSGITISGLIVKDSPQWLRNRLKAIGLRPINNIVDVTTYILWEYGQPLHAFDLKEIEGNKVLVRTLQEGTEFRTLDEADRKLSAEDLMICNTKGGMCIAGVFGGIGSGVKESTTDIFLESACFSPQWIRRTSQRHGLRTDAASRFEKGSDPNLTVDALKRAVHLLKKIGGSKVSSKLIDIYPEKVKLREIKISFDYIDKMIGQVIERQKIQKIFDLFDFEIVSSKDEELILRIPSSKVEVTRPADIVEEVLRIYGYNNIIMPGRSSFHLSHEKLLTEEKLFNELGQYLLNNGFYEAKSTSLVHSKMALASGISNERTVSVLNYASSELDILRPDMLLSALENVRLNLNQKSEQVKLFEKGKAYYNENYERVEKNYLTLTVCGRKLAEQWNSSRNKVDLLYLMAHTKNLLSKCGVNGLAQVEFSDQFFTGGISFEIPSGKGKAILAHVGKVSKKLLATYDIEQEVFFASIDWDELYKVLLTNKIIYKPVNRYPKIRRDLSLLIKKSIKFKDIKEIAFNTDKLTLDSVNLFDIFEGGNIEKNKKSYAVSFTFQAVDRTLTDKEVDKVMKRLIERLQNELDAKIR